MSGDDAGTHEAEDGAAALPDDLDAPAALEPAVAFAETRGGTPIGGWLLKATPTELGGLNDAGLVWTWPLNDSYRVELMEPGQPVFMWLTGSDDGQGDGLVGAGVVATWTSEDDFGGLGSAAAEGEPEAGEPDAGAVTTQVAAGLWIERLSTPVTLEHITAQGALGDMEVLTSLQMGNPLVLTPDEVNAIWDSFDLATDAPTEPGVQAAELYINEQTQEVLVAVLLPGRHLAMKYDQLDDLYYVISLEEGDTEVVSFGEFDDPLDAVGALVGECEPAAQGAAAPERSSDDLRFNVDDHEVIALFPWSEDGVRVIKVAEDAFEVGGEGWDDDAVSTFATFGEAVFAFSEAAFVESDDDEEAGVAEAADD